MQRLNIMNTPNQQQNEIDLLIGLWRRQNFAVMKEELGRTHSHVIECRMRNKKHSMKILQLMNEFKNEVFKNNLNVNAYYPLFQLMKSQIETYFHGEDDRVNNVFFVNMTNILNSIQNSTHVVDKLIDLAKANAYMLSSYNHIINNYSLHDRNLIQNLLHKLNETNESKAQMHNQLIMLNQELDFYKSAAGKHQRESYSPSLGIRAISPVTFSSCSSSATIDEYSDSQPCFVSLSEHDNEVNTKLIASQITVFLKQHSVTAKDFFQKVLRTSLLSFKNIIECPQEWSTLNSSFKLYYKRASIFLNNLVEQKTFLIQVKSVESENDSSVFAVDEKHNFILYDISKVIVRNGDEAIAIIDNVVRKLGENGLNKKILCDAVLGIPLNTMSLFCNKAEKWNEMSDYAKESVMRMYAWLCDPHGVAKLLDWKMKYYSTSTIKSQCASRVRRCFSGFQLKILLKEFDKNCTPNKDKISELSKITNLSEKTIMKWFRNRRYKCFKMSKQATVEETSDIKKVQRVENV